ncbi:GHKL domain-containing protein [Erysipelothrix urinaevulpis]|uniref:GHKL domain-containing protein n=1 Tax=Erysipelothrix urinaevulpis TaxID=2683717 RepID=UPI00135985E9|nr:GHKL domain-containing protein [Erysipelothrix urinaevulpis]
MFYGLKTVSVLLLLVFVIGIGVMAWLYKKILPPLQQISNKTTKHHLLILNAVKISYSSLVVVFLQENLSTFKGDVYIIIIIAIILGLFLNHYLFSSLLDYIRLTVDSDNLTILQDHLTSDRIRKDDLNQMEQNIQSLRHDLKQLANHFESLDRDSDSYQQMLSELNEEIDKNTKDQINFSDHELLNTYLYNFNKLCLKSHIDFKCLLIWDITNIDPFESIRLFSNLLTNSYEAVSKLEHSKRSITIHSAIWNDSWLDVSIKNPFDHAINKGLKSSKLNHDGLGVNQIKKIVEEHDGLIKFEVFDQQFEVLISIPINN